MSASELEEMLGWPAADGQPVTAEHRAFCAEHGHAPDHRPEPSETCARCGEPREERHNVYRDGQVHVLSEKCATCIFKPHERPVDGARVAGMIRDTMDTEGATVVCHKTLYTDEVGNAICRGWWDRFADRDNTLRLARAIGIVVEDELPGEGSL